jgi:hypothetical protein
MARSAIPDFGMEYPEYEYREWPKHIGLDKDGEQLVAKDQAEHDRLLPDVAFPKLMGKDKHGKDVIAQIPRDLDWKKDQLVKTSVPETENALTDEAPVRRGPGRPRAEAA